MISIIRIRTLYSRGGETGVSWSENCILTYDEVDTHIMVFFLRSALSIIIFLTYSIDFLSETDIFFYKHSRFPRANGYRQRGKLVQTAG